MDNLDPELIIKLLESSRNRRGRYEETILEFTMGRKPTEEELFQVRHDRELKRDLEKKWLAAQPWHVRKRHVSREDRLRQVILKRYNVPAILLDDYMEEARPYSDW